MGGVRRRGPVLAVQRRGRALSTFGIVANETAVACCARINSE